MKAKRAFLNVLKLSGLLGLLWLAGPTASWAEDDGAGAVSGGSLSGSTATSTPSMLLSAGVGLVVYGGDFAQLYNSGRLGYTVDASVMGQVTEAPLYVGVDFGLNFWGFDAQPIPGSDRSLSAVGIQVLPTAVYRFSVASIPELVPYFGFAVGPQFYILRDRTATPTRNVVNTNTDTHVYLELLARPGVEYHFSDNVAVSFEPKFGLLNFDFIFQPVASFALTL